MVKLMHLVSVSTMFVATLFFIHIKIYIALLFFKHINKIMHFISADFVGSIVTLND